MRNRCLILSIGNREKGREEYIAVEYGQTFVMDYLRKNLSIGLRIASGGYYAS